MTVDLFKSYKKFYQRWYARKSSPIRIQMKDLAHDLVKYLYENRSAYNQNLVKDRAIEMAEFLLQIEMKSHFENLVSPEIIEALNSGQFIIDVPYPVARRWNTDYMTGHVYVMTSKKMPGLSKLGATMMDLEVRARKYSNRYGYQVDLYFARQLLGPFNVEKFIGDKIRHRQLSGKNEYHTNEWYQMAPDKLKALILAYNI
jgi:hypothetical protein